MAPPGTRVTVMAGKKTQYTGVVAWTHNGRYTVLNKRFVEAGVRPEDVVVHRKRKRKKKAAARFRGNIQLSGRARGRIRLSSDAIDVGTRVAWLDAKEGAYFSGTLSRRVDNNKMVVDRDDHPNSPKKFILEPNDAHDWRLNYLEWLVMGQHGEEARKLVQYFGST